MSVNRSDMLILQSSKGVPLLARTITKDHSLLSVPVWEVIKPCSCAVLESEPVAHHWGPVQTLGFSMLIVIAIRLNHSTAETRLWFRCWASVVQIQDLLKACNNSPPNFLHQMNAIAPKYIDEFSFARQKHGTTTAAMLESWSTAELVELNYLRNLILDTIPLTCFCWT